MARPKVDGDEMRARFLKAAVSLLKESGGRRLVLSEVANVLGMTQSNAYRYFRSKDELIAALASQWFAAVENAASDAVARAAGPEEKIRSWLIAIMRAKLTRFDDDPDLFRSYLELAIAHPEVVSRHSEDLISIIDPSLIAMAGAAQKEAAVTLLQDATILFRNPYMIAQRRGEITEERALEVVNAIIAHWSRSKPII